MTKNANFQLLLNRLVFIKNNNHSHVVSSVFLYGRAYEGGGVQDNFSTSSHKAYSNLIFNHFYWDYSSYLIFFSLKIFWHWCLTVFCVKLFLGLKLVKFLINNKKKILNGHLGKLLRPNLRKSQDWMIVWLDKKKCACPKHHKWLSTCCIKNNLMKIKCQKQLGLYLPKSSKSNSK